LSSIFIYFSLTFSLIYFLLRNRIDFPLVFLASTIIYHWQIIGGKIIIPPYYFDANEESKLVIGLVLFIHTTATFLFDKSNFNRINYQDFVISKKYDSLAYILCFISLFLTFKAFLSVGINFIYKQEYSGALRNAGISMVWLHYPAAISLLYATLTKKRILFLLSIVPLLFYAYMGYRAVIVLALIGSITIYSYNAKLNTIKAIRISLLTIIIFVFFASYKVTYYNFKDKEISVSENFKLRSSYFEENEYIKKILFYNEFGQTASNLSLSIEANLGKYYSLSIVIIGSIPFVKKITKINEDDVRFNRLIERYANPGFSYGLGSSIWAEAYAAFNLVGVIMFAFLLSIIISFLNKSFYRPKSLFVFSPLFLSFLSFYIHRSELTLFFAHLKNLIFLILMSFIILIIIQNLKLFIVNQSKFINKI